MATFDNSAVLPSITQFEGLFLFTYDDVALNPLQPMNEGFIVQVWDNQATLPTTPQFEAATYSSDIGTDMGAFSLNLAGLAPAEHWGTIGSYSTPPSFYASGRRGPVLEVAQNSTRNVYFFMRALDTGAGTAGFIPSLVVNQSKNGAPGTVVTPTIADLGGSLGPGWYVMTLTATHTGTLGESAFHITATAALPNDDVIINVIAINKQDGVRAGLTALPNAAAATPDGLPTAEMVTNIAVTGAALNTVAASRTITTGTESGVLANTDALDAVFHTFADVGGVIDIYYEFNISATLNAVGVSAQWKGYFNTTPYVMNVYAWNWTNSAWDGLGSIAASSDTVVYGGDFALTNSHTSAGIARIRFANTGITGATFATDRLLLGYAVTPSTPTAIANQMLDSSLTGHTTAGTVGGSLNNIVTPSAIASAVLNAARNGYVTLGTIGEGIALAAALLQGNFYMDNVVNVANGQTNARLRVFHTGAAAGAATPGGTGEGEFATFLVTTSYSGPNKVIDHRVVQQ